MIRHYWRSNVHVSLGRVVSTRTQLYIVQHLIVFPPTYYVLGIRLLHLLIPLTLSLTVWTQLFILQVPAWCHQWMGGELSIISDQSPTLSWQHHHHPHPHPPPPQVSLPFHPQDVMSLQLPQSNSVKQTFQLLLPHFISACCLFATREIIIQLEFHHVANCSSEEVF